MIARLYRYLFPPTPLPGDDGRNATMRRLLGPQIPWLSVRPADVERRWEALRPRTAVEKLEADVDRAVAAAEREMHEEWERRR